MDEQPRSAAAAAARGGKGDGGKAGVARKVVKDKVDEIEASKGGFDEKLAEIEKNEGRPPPEMKLATNAAEELCCAVGSLVSINYTLDSQIADMAARNAPEAALDAVRQDQSDASNQLLAVRNLQVNDWKLPIPEAALAMANPEEFSNCKIGNAPGEITKQYIIGAILLDAESKTKRPGGGGDDVGMSAASTSITLPSGEVRLDVWDHGEIEEEEAEERVEGFLISTRPKGFKSEQGEIGEFWLSARFDGSSVHHFPITTDTTTKMLLVPNLLKEVNSYDGATTLHALVAALSSPARANPKDGQRHSTAFHLQHPTPSPESKIGGTIENPERFAVLMTQYSAARTAISGPLVRQVMKDMVAYNEATDRHTALAGTAYMKRLAAAATPEASASMRFTKEEVHKMT